MTQEKTNEEIVGDLIESLDDIPCINRGGCLFAAYATYLKAKELDIKKIAILQVDWCDGFLTLRNKAFLDGKASSPVSGNHFVIKIGSQLFDSRGEYNLGSYSDLTISDEEEVHKLCINSLKESDWNDSFDRESGVKKIKEIIGIDLSHCL